MYLAYPLLWDARKTSSEILFADIIIIDNDGKLKNLNNHPILFNKLMKEINNQKLSTTRIILSREDYDLIMSWGKNDT